MVEDFKLALKIRAVEKQFLDMFSNSLLNDTVHACMGLEPSALGVLKFLNNNDYVFSDHRCYGNYVVFTNDYRSLTDEIIGKETGVCGGVGGSQHISGQNFFSTGNNICYPNSAITSSISNTVCNYVVINHNNQYLG